MVKPQILSLQMSFIIQPASEINVPVSWNLLGELSWQCYNKLFWVQIWWPFQESSAESLGAGASWGLWWCSVRFNTLQAKNSVCCFSARKVIANSRPILPSCDDREPKEKPDSPQVATVLVHIDADQQVWSLVWESCHTIDHLWEYAYVLWGLCLAAVAENLSVCWKICLRNCTVGLCWTHYCQARLIQVPPPWMCLWCAMVSGVVTQKLLYLFARKASVLYEKGGNEEIEWITRM